MPSPSILDQDVLNSFLNELNDKLAEESNTSRLSKKFESKFRFNDDSLAIMGSGKVMSLDGSYCMVFLGVTPNPKKPQSITAFTVTLFDPEKWPNNPKPQVSYDPTLVIDPTTPQIELAFVILEEVFPPRFFTTPRNSVSES